MLETDDVYKRKVVEKLHDNEWSEELVCEIFKPVFDNLLTKTERAITQLKIDGEEDSVIGELLGMSPASVKRHCYEIKKMYRVEQRTRVDHFYDVKALQRFREDIQTVVESVVESKKRVKQTMELLEPLIQGIFNLGVVHAKKYYKVGVKRNR